MVDGCDLPAGFYAPLDATHRALYRSRDRSKVTADASEFSEDVVRATTGSSRDIRASEGSSEHARPRWLTEAAIALSIYIAIGSSTAQAHPHVWIDLTGTVVLDDAGRITAIEQQWLFDPLYTVFATDE